MEKSCIAEDWLQPNHISEAGQYYAFFCEIATPESHGQLWDLLVHEFGCGRDCNLVYSDVCDANFLVGLTLRLDLLFRHGVDQKPLQENLWIYTARWQN